MCHSVAIETPISFADVVNHGVAFVSRLRNLQVKSFYDGVSQVRQVIQPKSIFSYKGSPTIRFTNEEMETLARPFDRSIVVLSLMVFYLYQTFLNASEISNLEEAIFEVAQMIGKSLRVDEKTASLSHFSEARVCVECDITKTYLKLLHYSLRTFPIFSM